MEHRQTFIDAALAAMGHGTPFALAKDLDKLTAAGFSVSLASVRDHTNCQDCGNREWICSGWAAAIRPCRGPGCLFDHIPCPGGSPVVWSTEP